MPEPSSNARTCARYGLGTHTAHATELSRGISFSSALSNASLPAGLPLSFQLPATPFGRIPPPEPNDFTASQHGGSICRGSSFPREREPVEWIPAFAGMTLEPTR